MACDEHRQVALRDCDDLHGFASTPSANSLAKRSSAKLVGIGTTDAKQTLVEEFSNQQASDLHDSDTASVTYTTVREYRSWSLRKGVWIRPLLTSTQ
jgi:hypothetical protein